MIKLLLKTKKEPLTWTSKYYVVHCILRVLIHYHLVHFQVYFYPVTGKFGDYEGMQRLCCKDVMMMSIFVESVPKLEKNITSYLEEAGM